MATDSFKENAEDVAIPVAPEDPSITYDASFEPAYGWVVCIAMHLINGFTWGICAV